MDIISYGGGVNSTAMTILLVQEGWRGPILYGETGAEWPETDVFVGVFNSWLVERGLEITTVGAAWRRPSMRLSLPEHCKERRTIPLRWPRWCTSHYKVYPIAKWMKAHGYTGKLLGISAEESQRCKKEQRPLCDRGIDRKGCVEIIEAAGLPVPVRSRCWFCPMQPKAAWRELWDKHPDLYAQASAIELGASPRKSGRRATLDPSGKITLAERALQYVE